jgi:hypothetical protein
LPKRKEERRNSSISIFESLDENEVPLFVHKNAVKYKITVKRRIQCYKRKKMTPRRIN